MRLAWIVIACVACAACSASDRDRPARAERDEPRPQVPQRILAIGQTAGYAPDVRRAFDPEGFTPAGTPEPGEWLAEHEETPQSFDRYIRSRPNLPTSQRRVIYLLPLGEFSADAPSLLALARIAQAFYTLEVHVLPAVAIGDVTAHVKTRTHASTRRRQLLAPDVLKWLAQRVPDDAYALMAITMEDLYPEPSWNFVFGMASLSERVGVQSFARQDPAFFDEPREPGWQQLALRRATWTLVHEIAHMFGLPHCTYWTCVVAGSNHQAEADRAPLRPCPVCLHKLYWAIDFDPATREAELANVLREYGIIDEAAWSERRAAWIRDGKR